VISIRVNSDLPRVIYVIFGFSPCKIFFLDSVLVIWRFFCFRPSWKILPPVIWGNFGLPPCNLSKFRFTPVNLSKFWFYLPFISLILYSQNSWRSKTKKLQITRAKSKMKILQGKTGNDICCRGKALLTLSITQAQL